MRDKIEGERTGGTRDDTCDHGLSRGSRVDVYKIINEKLLQTGDPWVETTPS